MDKAVEVAKDRMSRYSVTVSADAREYTHAVSFLMVLVVYKH